MGGPRAAEAARVSARQRWQRRQRRYQRQRRCRRVGGNRRAFHALFVPGGPFGAPVPEGATPVQITSAPPPTAT